MYTPTLLSIVPLLAASFAAPVKEVKRAESASCPSYTIINTRGTSEPQGPSVGFRTMNSRVTAALDGGKTYDTVYPASISQNSEAGMTDIINKITSTLKTNPDECFILEGYSQGAQATVNAMPKLTGANFDAVKGVFLIGNPAHKSGLECNVDNNNGTTTRDVNGLSARLGGGIPSNWVSKTLDVCILVSVLSWSKASIEDNILTSDYREMVSVIQKMVRVSMLSIFSTVAIPLHKTSVRSTSRSSLLE